jgi:NAD-dependent dihydropyrimidine dehydrogenase PreA subunit
MKLPKLRHLSSAVAAAAADDVTIAHNRCTSCVQACTQQVYQLCTGMHTTGAPAVYRHAHNRCTSCVQACTQQLHQLCTGMHTTAAPAVYRHAHNRCTSCVQACTQQSQTVGLPKQFTISGSVLTLPSTTAISPQSKTVSCVISSECTTGPTIMKRSLHSSYKRELHCLR